jgi:hypothetical protein
LATAWGIHSPDDPAAQAFGPWPPRRDNESMSRIVAVLEADLSIGMR